MTLYFWTKVQQFKRWYPPSGLLDSEDGYWWISWNNRTPARNLSHVDAFGQPVNFTTTQSQSHIISDW